MQCQHAIEHLSDYLDGSADSAKRAAVEAHLSACPACAAVLTGLRTTWHKLDELPDATPPMFLHDNVLHHVVADYEKRMAPRAPWWSTLFQARNLAYAAALVVVFFAGSTFTAQRADLDPLAGLFSRGHRAVTLAAADVTGQLQWRTGGPDGDSWTLHLAASHKGAAGTVEYHVPLPGGTVLSGELASDQSVTLNLPVPAGASAESDVPVTLTATGKTSVLNLRPVVTATEQTP